VVSERKQSRQRQQRAVEAVSAYLHDADPDIYHWLDEAIKDDAMSVAWALTRLAATAVADLAEATGRPADDALAATAARAFPD
jgi:hypothetical protein